MVDQSGGYYGTEFQSFRGLTQGDSISSTIFNVVLNAVVRHWVEETVESAGRQGGGGQEGIHQNPLSYADDGMIALSDLGWLQGVFSTLVSLFDLLSLRKNVRKTVGMV